MGVRHGAVPPHWQKVCYDGLWLRLALHFEETGPGRNLILVDTSWH